MKQLILWLVASFSILALLSRPVAALGSHQMARRDPGEFDSLLSELKSKAMGGRMRFGKRASKASDFNMDPDVYSPDRYLWLQ
ncbi:hypothetical protein L596_027293 [Steinernema carpocapsae]|uniref:Uncharacterized protein n=1 Tax=Steinernema carpocapsae TaxID=34508 RepID=A0A4U5M3V6_STECR|nr:hypothetical protein L596_027293 [Steinernema carpocapsae]